MDHPLIQPAFLFRKALQVKKVGHTAVALVHLTSTALHQPNPLLHEGTNRNLNSNQEENAFMKSYKRKRGRERQSRKR
ncbi:hypothetical protein PROFUN_00667 [Planoprotostelium fungivorum]|uniref:Uncharacterized protein n=1 Tax=Planoprotostelium fungivorum TaxID=1890364 RepID=A0A2P6NU45_9EUKA|nr:hypothetical protein PROFUN_00667 [Planoprotostelium fungivorum]